MQFFPQKIELSRKHKCEMTHYIVMNINKKNSVDTTFSRDLAKEEKL